MNKCLWEEKDLNVITVNILMLLLINKTLVIFQSILKVREGRKTMDSAFDYIRKGFKASKGIP